MLEVEGAGDLTMERLASLARADFLTEVFGRQRHLPRGAGARMAVTAPRRAASAQEGARALPQPRAVLARVQRPRAGGGDGPHHPAPRPAEVRDHRRPPTSTSSSWCGWPRSSTRSRRATPRPTWPASARASSSSWSRERAHEMVDALGHDARRARSCPRLAERGIRIVRPGRAGGRSSARSSRATSRPRCCPRSRRWPSTSRGPSRTLANLSLNLALLLAPAGGRGAAAAGRGAGAGRPAPAGAPAGRRRHHLRAAGGDHPRRAGRALPGPDGRWSRRPSASRATRRWSSTTRAGATTWRRSRRSCASGARSQVVRLEVEAGVGDALLGDPRRAAGDRGARTSTASRGPLDIRALQPLVELPALEHLREPPLKPLPVLRAARAGRTSSRGCDERRRAAAPPLRVVRPRGRVRVRAPPTTPTCWPSSRRSTAPAATRPIVQALAARGRERQAGHGAGGADGALRRAVQHPLGAQPGGVGRPRHLRHPRLQDPRQDLPGGAARAARASSATSTWAPATTTTAPRASTPTSAS